MKFRNDIDLQCFLAEVGSSLSVVHQGNGGETVVPTELSEAFFLKRQPLLVSMKSFRRHQAGKRVWNIARWKLLRGIRAFHKSAEGKRFHRSLGRFLATRLFLPKTKDSEHWLFMTNEALKAIASTRTFFYIAREYYMPLNEAADLEVFGDYALPLLQDIEEQLLQNPNTDLQSDQYELLLRIVERSELGRCLREVEPALVHNPTLIQMVEASADDDANTYQMLQWCKELGATINVPPLVEVAELEDTM